MKVIINDKGEKTTSKTLLELSNEMKLPEKGVAVAVNNNIGPREEWRTYALHENDNIFIIKAVCGG